MRLVSLCQSAGAQLVEGEEEPSPTLSLVEKFKALK